MTVKFRQCELFRQTLAKHKQEVSAKLQEFIKQKSADPMSRFGAKDQHFVAGVLRDSGLIHAHLTHDISILYKRHGKNPTLIDLYAIASHDELGTGQPANLKKQKSIVKVASNQEF
jgi:mRNA-degrading endonuclease YafQ of YafQ-DinJ toxin-antitoxin module